MTGLRKHFWRHRWALAWHHKALVHGDGLGVSLWLCPCGASRRVTHGE